MGARSSAGDTEGEYVTEIREVRRKKGTVRSKSSKSADFESDLLRTEDSNELAGPTESRAIDEAELRNRYQDDTFAYVPDSAETEPQLTPGQEAFIEWVADLAAEFTMTIVNEAVVPLVRDYAWPAAKTKMSGWVQRRRGLPPGHPHTDLPVGTALASTEGEDTPATEGSGAALSEIEPSVPMTERDLLAARLRLQMAEAYAQQQRWLIAHADVTDEGASPELQRSVQLLLDGRADELNDDQRAAIMELLGQTGLDVDSGSAREVER